MEYVEDTPSFRKVAPIKIPPRTDKKIKPEKIFEGLDTKKKRKGEKQKKKAPKRVKY
tara:strand:- start:195 stop:365 length:171 start_codon:yes stop_codon:yes gene_type:complete